jgi:hypothetical protein
MTDLNLPQVPKGRMHNRPQLVRARLTAAQFNRLLRAAERRGITPVDLVTRIVGAVLDDNIITAVLDDGSKGESDAAA